MFSVHFFLTVMDLIRLIHQIRNALTYEPPFYGRLLLVYERNELNELRGGASKPRFYERNELNELRAVLWLVYLRKKRNKRIKGV